MSAKKYLLVFALSLMTLSALVVTLNRVVDPFWYFRDVSIDGVNAIKPKFRNFERYVKPLLVQSEQPAALIFGSSYAEIGFDPLHPALNKFGHGYNFALAGAQWDMVYCDVQFALAKDQNLRQIVLGIHPGALPKHDCTAEIDRMATSDLRAFLFSYDALQATINTLTEQYQQKPSHTAQGQYFYTRGVTGTDSRFREYFAQHPPCKFLHAVPEPDVVPPVIERTDLDMSGLQDIMRAALRRGIVLKLVVYPSHAMVIEQQYQCGTRQQRWNELTQLAAVVEATNSDLVEIWDFEGYHALGTESISEAAGHTWQDPRHFNAEMGDIMLDEMFGLAPPQLGMRITTQDIARRADAERKQRALYLAGHPEFLQRLDSLLPAR